jgi:hypothetical protein
MVSEKEKDVDDVHPVSNATVVAVPEEKYRNLPDHFGLGETDQHGHFTIRGSPREVTRSMHGKDVEENVYRDPDFLKSAGSEWHGFESGGGFASAGYLEVESGRRWQ